MSDFSDIMGRTDSAAELPEQLAQDLVLGTIRSSTALALGRQVPTTVRDSRIPVLSEIPEAYWVDNTDTNESGLKQTTKAIFQNEVLIAEEIAAIAPIPANILDDSKFDLWGAVKPLLVQACAKKIDNAVLFGIGAPSTWGPSVVDSAIAAGTNVFSADVFNPATDNAQAVLNAATLPALQGYNPDAVAVSPGWEFRAAAQRTPALVNNPVGSDQVFPMLLAGLGVHTRPLRWDLTANVDAIVAQWDYVVVGMRSDVTLQIFDTGVISDDTGKVILNLMQQDAFAARVTMRVGYLLLNPPTDANLDAAHRCPVGLVVNSGVGARKPVTKAQK